MQRGEIWFAAAPGGERPVLVLTRDPVGVRRLVTLLAPPRMAQAYATLRNATGC